MIAARKTYTSPRIKKQDKMVFVLRGIAGPKNGLACRQCSSCHGCR